MSDSPYTPPKVWTWDTASGGQFAMPQLMRPDPLTRVR